MTNNTLRDKIYLAALLHDIGKFYQRADVAGVANSKILSESIKNSESVYCPQFKGNYSHKHVLWTAQFIDDLGTHLKKITGETEYSLEHLAGKHHHPSNFYEEIIQLADHLSSGLDRAEGMPTDDLKGWDKFKKVRMYSVFESLMKQENLDQCEYQLPLESIQFKNNFFPEKSFTDEPDYYSLWKNFVGELKFIQTDSYRVFAESLYFLLLKYTGNIVSSTLNLPDVSLFDHLKTTAAIATCLYDIAETKNINRIEDLRKVEKPLLLIGGDVSGIQSYIYDIVSKSAAKNLKGRSFYIQLLVETIIQKIINELGLFGSNTIYSSGGGFYLLAANTDEVKQKLAVLGAEISESLLREHGTALYLAIDWQEISIENIKQKKINESWRLLIEKMNRKKRQRYKNQLSFQYDYFFEAKGAGGELERDALTGEEFLENENKIVYQVGDSGLKEFIKPYTEQQIKLGRILKQAQFWISSNEQLSYINTKYAIEVCDLGIFHYFLPEDELKLVKSKLRDAKGKVRILNMNGANFLDVNKGVNNIYGFNLYGGNDFPAADDGSPLTFDELSGEGDFKRLGFLRMDVDNLGMIFSKGFTDEKCTFSRYSALSRSLDYFFKGYINTIWEKEEYCKTTFIIYSGGDDLFLVGRWDKLIEMAEDIRNQFRLWTCKNPHLSISGGLAVVPDKFPVLKAAQQAAGAEHQAKNHLLKTGVDKNAFTVLNVPLNWDVEYPLVKNLKNIIKNLLEENRLPKSFSSKLQAHFANARIKNGEITKLNVLWMMAYDFTRLADSVKKSDPEARQFVIDVKDWVFTNKHPDIEKNSSQYHVFELINLATRWAELELRTNKK